MTQYIEEPQTPLTIEQVVKDWRDANSLPLPEGLEQNLVERMTVRDEQVADYLRVMGDRLGAMPQFVAKALMDGGIGRPKTDDERNLINAGFDTAMEELRRIWEAHERGDHDH